MISRTIKIVGATVVALLFVLILNADLISSESYAQEGDGDAVKANTGERTENWGEDIRLTYADGASAEPDIAIDREGNLNIVWWDEMGGGYDIYYSKLDPSGHKLIDSISLISCPGNCFSPSIDFDSQNNMYVAWHDSLNGVEVYFSKFDSQLNPILYRVRVSYSDGYAWYSRMDIDNEDNIHIIWQDNRDGEYYLYYKKLDSNGNILVDELSLGLSFEYSRPSLADDSQGNIHITWADDRDGNEEIYYTKLDSNGNTLIDDLRLTYSAWSSEPSLSTDIQGNVHISFSKFIDGFSVIYYEKLDNNGNILIDDLRLTFASAGSYNSNLTLDIQENVHIFWHEAWEGQMWLSYTRLDSSGSIVVDNEHITPSNNSSRTPGLVSDTANDLHVVWDTGLTDKEVYYKRSFYNPKGGIYGIVEDSEGGYPVENAEILLLQGGIVISGTTSYIDGYFSFSYLQPGLYDLIVSKNGYDGVEINGIDISSSEAVEQNIILFQPTSDVNLSMTKLEVNQAVDSDKLVGDKATYVRAYPALEGLNKVKDVTAAIQAIRNGSVYYIQDASLTQDVKSDYTENERIRAKNSYNFRLGELPEGTYEFTVTLTIPDGVEDNNPDDDTIARTVDLVTLDGPKIIGVPIYYDGEGPDHEQIRKADNLMKKTFPYSDYTFEPEVGYILDSMCDPANEDCFTTQLPNQLGVIIKNYNRNNPDSRASLVYGFLNKDVGSPPGISYPPQGSSEFDFGVAMVRAFNHKHILGQIFSHELVHQYGLWPLYGGEDVKVVCSQCITENNCQFICENYQVYNNEKGRNIIAEDGSFDAILEITAYKRYDTFLNRYLNKLRRTIMGSTIGDLDLGHPFDPTQAYWIEKFDYEYIFDHELAEQKAGGNGMMSGTYLDISGIIYIDDTLYLNPWHIIDGTYTPNTPDPEGEYSIHLLDGQNLLYEHTFTLSQANGPDEAVTGPFSLTLPYYANTDTISILHNDIVIATRTLSAHAPTVEVVSPNGGENWTGEQTIVWSADDEDNDDLTYSVYYSPDNGLTWRVLVSNYNQTSFSWDTTTAGGCNNCLVKVEANDSLLTRSDVSDAIFTLAGHDPSASINHPTDGASFSITETVVLQGEGYDLEDGFLVDINLIWESDIDGMLGNGEMISPDLSVGTHHITLTATDSDLNIATQQITVQVSDDADNDGMPDDWEADYGLNPDYDDSDLDPDQDGAINIDEYAFGTNPIVWNPVLKQISDRTIGEKKTLSIKPEVLSNPQGYPVTYSIDSSKFTWDGMYFKWSIGPHDSGYYTFTISVTDGTSWDYKTFQVTVADTCRIFIKEEWRWDCEPGMFMPIDSQQNEVYY